MPDLDLMNIDEKDLVLLRELLKNSRVSYSDLAKKVDMSDVAVIKRIKKLENMGVIKAYTIVVDPRKIGYKLVCFTGINVEPENMFKVLEELKHIENIRYIGITSGDHHLMVIIWARDQSELSQIHEKIESIQGVVKVYPAILLQEAKGPVCL